MATLYEIDRSGARLRAGNADGSPPLQPLASWQPGSGNGLLLPVDAEPEQAFAEAPLIAIDFPTFHDGRGLSLAVLLRTRVGFTGELRAVGDVHPELVHYLARCGFDSLTLAEERGLSGDGWLAPHTDYYQASVAEAQPAFRRGRRGV